MNKISKHKECCYQAQYEICQQQPDRVWVLILGSNKLQSWISNHLSLCQLCHTSAYSPPSEQAVICTILKCILYSLLTFPLDKFCSKAPLRQSRVTWSSVTSHDNLLPTFLFQQSSREEESIRPRKLLIVNNVSLNIIPTKC